MKKIETLTKKIGTQRAAQIMLNVIEESKAGEYNQEFRRTLTPDEKELIDLYEEAYVVALLSRIAARIRSVMR